MRLCPCLKLKYLLSCIHVNLITLEPQDFIDPHTVILKDRRHSHITEILKSKLGDCLRVGLINGFTGTGTICQINAEAVTLNVRQLNDQGIPPLPLSIILALPRPRVLNRILQTSASLGVKHLILIHTQRVEKSYWQTPLLKPENVHLQLRLGLEQACSTHIPTITYHRHFQSFINESVKDINEHSERFVAHPGHYISCPTAQPKRHIVMAIGPEGGFIPREIEQLTKLDFRPIQIGQRILRVETALTYLIAKLF